MRCDTLAPCFTCERNAPHEEIAHVLRRIRVNLTGAAPRKFTSGTSSRGLGAIVASDGSTDARGSARSGATSWRHCASSKLNWCTQSPKYTVRVWLGQPHDTR